MVKETRSTRDIVICVETELINLKTHFENHIKHHDEREKEAKRHNRALIVVAVGAILTSIGSLMVGMALIGWN
jgi:hypothetical protein